MKDERNKRKRNMVHKNNNQILLGLSQDSGEYYIAPGENCCRM
jgi:hypothetical protein